MCDVCVYISTVTNRWVIISMKADVYIVNSETNQVFNWKLSWCAHDTRRGHTVAKLIADWIKQHYYDNHTRNDSDVEQITIIEHTRTYRW